MFENLDMDPIGQFNHWLTEAEQKKLPHPNAMTLATVNRQGQPFARIVLLRGIDTRGFVFHTNYESDKGIQISENPRAALVFFWPQLKRQVRVEGTVEKIAANESDTYFATRPRGHQVSAHVSRQSKVIETRAIIEQQQEYNEKQFSGKQVPRPDHWGGYRVVPHVLEFWQEGEQRLHDRLRYRKDVTGEWLVERLSP